MQHSNADGIASFITSVILVFALIGLLALLALLWTHFIGPAVCG